MSSQHLPPLSDDQWIDIIRYLSADDFKSLRLAGNKSMRLYDPALTSHLRLRIDRVSFLLRSSAHNTDCHTIAEAHRARRWFVRRDRLVINGANAQICPRRMAYLVSNGYCNSVSELIVHDSHRHGAIIGIFSRLPNLKSLVLIDRRDHVDVGFDAAAPNVEEVVEMENIIRHVGRMRSLASLVIEFDVVVRGARLSFLEGLRNLTQLRLVGFDLSEGIGHVGNLKSLEMLHLCHGNFTNSPGGDANEKDLTELIGLTNIRTLKLEGFDYLTGVGLDPFGSAWTSSVRDLLLKHCQAMSEECLVPIGRMSNLVSLHILTTISDDIDVFERESLLHLNTLSALESLSLFYVLDEPEDLQVLIGLTALESLNLAFDDAMDIDEIEYLCAILLQTFASLRTLRIFSEDGSMEREGFRYKGLEVEYATFTFWDF